MARLLRILALALALVGCDDPAPETPQPIANEQEPVEREEPPPPPVAPLDDPAPSPVTFAVPEDPAALPELTLLPTGRRIVSRGGGWQVPQVEDEALQRRLGMLFEQLGYTYASTESPDDGFAEEGVEDFGGCRPVLATARVVSVICYQVQLSRISGTTNGFGAAKHFAITDGQIVPFDMEDVLEEGQTLRALITEDLCVEEQLRQGVRRMLAIRQCRPAVNTPEQWVLGPRGFEHPYEVERSDPPRVVVSYAAVRSALREDGPIAWVFEAERPALWASEADATGLAITDVVPYAELLTDAAGLDDDVLARVRVQDFDGLLGRLVLPSTEALAEARALATRVGGEVHRARWEGDQLRSLARVRTSESAKLHTQPTGTSWGAVRRTLPAGTHLVALAGADGSLPEGRTMVAGGHALIGYVEAPRLAAHTGCRPDPRRFLESFPAAAREAARERLHVASTTVRTDAAAEPRSIALFASMADRETRVALVAMDEACALGETVFEQTIPGTLFDLRMGTSERNGAGESFLLAGVYRGERLRTWRAFRISNGREIFSATPDREELVRNQTSFDWYVQLDAQATEGDESSWAPLIYQGRRYRWTGRLVPVGD
ncbi:MAG: hypothetical protein KC619_00215 [Myxococcales bacterium]|nr:hypothetical protein [Myxococcales bacterium]